MELADVVVVNKADGDLLPRRPAGHRRLPPGGPPAAAQARRLGGAGAGHVGAARARASMRCGAPWRSSSPTSARTTRSDASVPARRWRGCGTRSASTSSTRSAATPGRRALVRHRGGRPGRPAVPDHRGPPPARGPRRRPPTRDGTRCTSRREYPSGTASLRGDQIPMSSRPARSGAAREPRYRKAGRPAAVRSARTSPAGASARLAVPPAPDVRSSCPRSPTRPWSPALAAAPEPPA